MKQTVPEAKNLGSWTGPFRLEGGQTHHGWIGWVTFDLPLDVFESRVKQIAPGRRDDHGDSSGAATAASAADLPSRGGCYVLIPPRFQYGDGNLAAFALA